MLNTKTISNKNVSVIESCIKDVKEFVEINHKESEYQEFLKQYNKKYRVLKKRDLVVN